MPTQELSSVLSWTDCSALFTDTVQCSMVYLKGFCSGSSLPQFCPTGLFLCGGFLPGDLYVTSLWDGCVIVASPPSLHM
jgi:hypothetical protein